MKLSDFPKVEVLRERRSNLTADLAALQPDDVRFIKIQSLRFIGQDGLVISSSGYDDETAAFLDALRVIRDFLQARIDRTTEELAALGVTVD